MTAAPGFARSAIETLFGHIATLGQELADTSVAGERARTCTRTALAVVLAVTIAQALSLDEVWWAGISGLMASQATQPASIARSILRIVGTSVGSILGYLAVGLFAYDHVAVCLFLFIASTIGVLGMSVSPHGYAWMLSGLTANMIVIMTMNDPSQAPFAAGYRVTEVAIGCFAAVLMAVMMGPTEGAEAPAAPPGWRDLLGRHWSAVQHAVRSGITVALMPVVWNLFNLPSLSQMAITATAVMAVPVPAGGSAEVQAIVTGRSLLRITGCVLGGLLGLVCLGLQLTVYPLWLVLLFGGVWIAVYVQGIPSTVSYVGTQAGIVFVMTLVQGPGPPDSITPGIERFAGILGGLAVILLVGLALGPMQTDDDPA